MKKYICDKCKTEFSKEISQEHGYDICKSCYNDLMVVVKDFFIEEYDKEPGTIKKMINKMLPQEELDKPAYLRREKRNK